MLDLRNPFKERRSELIDNEETFLRLYSPGVLDILDDKDLWNKPLRIKSAPGGGKTSLLRIFTPKSLHALYGVRDREHYKDLYLKLQSLGALDNDGPKVLGIFLYGGMRKYAKLEYIDIDRLQKNRLFFSLLNSRIVLAMLRSALEYTQNSYPEDLKILSIKFKKIDNLQDGWKLEYQGNELFEWAKVTENDIGSFLDSFEYPSAPRYKGLDSIEILDLLQYVSIKVGHKEVAGNVVVMFDDLHELSQHQHECLLDDVIKSRRKLGVWLSERLEALGFDELLSEDMTLGRDHNEIKIEDYWGGKSGNKFERILINVADRRCKESTVIDISSFDSCLKDVLDNQDLQEQFKDIVAKVSEKVLNFTSKGSRYLSWLEEIGNLTLTPKEMATKWIALRILIEREERKNQQELEFQLSPEKLEKDEDSAVRGAAELFLHHEFKIPYYYGINRLSKISSSNIQQFLWLSGELFEYAVSSNLLNRTAAIDPENQENILKGAINKHWVSNRSKFDHRLYRFIDSIGQFSRQETLKPNAPYSPGVSGIAISMDERESLIEASGKNDKVLKTLAEIITTSIANNLLEIKLNYKCKDKRWMIIYLNRMLCVYYGLPLQYGGWREQSLNSMVSWVEQGFSKTKKENILL